MPWGEDPPPPNVLIDKMISAMAADLRKDIELLEREQDRMITLLQQIIEENRRIRQMWQEVPIVHLSSELPSNNAMAPNSSDQARNISTSSILQNIKREPSDEVDARADEGYLQKLKAAPSRFADHTSRKRIAKNTSHLYQKSPRFTGSPRATPCRILKQEIKDEPREDNDSLPTLDEPIDEDEPYTGDVEVEKAIYYDSSNVVDYASRLANFVFEGLPEMPYSKLPRNRREWVNEMVERRYPCPASENTKKYAEKWHRNVILRRVKTIRRLENIDFNLDALLSYGSMPSKIGRLLSIAFVPPNLEHEAFLNSSDELQYAIRLSTLLWPLTGKPPIQTDGLDREDEERFKYLSVALDERYPIAKDNSEKRCESILKKIREKN